MIIVPTFPCELQLVVSFCKLLYVIIHSFSILDNVFQYGFQFFLQA